MVADQSESLLAGLGGLLAPVFAPLGFGDWRVSCALVCGLIAKESVISTLTVLLGATSAGALSGIFSPLTAYVFLAFTLLYPPCVAAISTVKSELGGRYAVAVFALQVCVAWVVASYCTRPAWPWAWPRADSVAVNPLVSRVALGRLRFSPLRHNPGRQL